MNIVDTYQTNVEKSDPAVAQRLRDVFHNADATRHQIERHTSNDEFRQHAIEALTESMLNAAISIVGQNHPVAAIYADHLTELHHVEDLDVVIEEEPFDPTTLSTEELRVNLESQGVDTEGMDREAMVRRMTELAEDV